MRLLCSIFSIIIIIIIIINFVGKKFWHIGKGKKRRKKAKARRLHEMRVQPRAKKERGVIQHVSPVRIRKSLAFPLRCQYLVP